MLALIAANFPFAYFCLTLNLHIFLIPLLNIPPPYKKKTPKIVLEHLYKLCKRIPLNISHDRLLLLWLTAIIQSSLQVFSIFAHVSAYSLNFYYPIEKNKKKKKEGKRVRIIAFTISRSHVSHLKPYFCQGIQT